MKEKPIYFHNESIDFKVVNEQKVLSWIEKTILEESFSLGNLNFIFCSDDYLLNLNKEYLNHDTYTDIVTFNYCENNIISGDLFISIDRIKDNSTQLKLSFNSELNRVIIHGVLHLIGYNDKTPEEILEMRAKEDFYLNLLSDF